MQKGFFADTLSSRPAFWNAMLRANAGTAGKKGISVVMPGEDVASLLHWLQERPSVLRSAVERKNQMNGFWDFAEESRRLALLDPDTLNRLGLVTGVALHAPDIACVLRRDEVLALRRELGNEMYQYALFRGRYELGSVRRFFNAQEDGVPLGQLCLLHGVMALRLLAEDWPRELGQRFDVRLPHLHAEMKVPALDRRSRDELWRAVKKLLLKEVAPSWGPCFN